MRETWRTYVEQFHDERAGITEEVLGEVSVGDRSPYEWVVEPFRSTDQLVLDVACGSAPLFDLFPLNGWVGLDRSSGELHRAVGRGARPLLRADASTIPLSDGSVGGVVCSMALMIVEPLEQVLQEMSRVLRPGGFLVALVPTGGPLTIGDRVRYGRLLLALRRRRLDYVNDSQLEDVPLLFSRSGLRIVSDQRLRFDWSVRSQAAATAFVRSLYLPSGRPHRVAKAERVARRWVGREIGLPLRRIVALRDG